MQNTKVLYYGTIKNTLFIKYNPVMDKDFINLINMMDNLNVSVDNLNKLHMENIKLCQ